MDEKGYTITPAVFLLMIPVIIFAVAFGDIVNEINQFSTVTIGSDVTGGTVSNIYSAIKYGAIDSGRYASYNASRTVIDSQLFLGDSKLYVRQVTTARLNEHVIDACRKISNETGRTIYINNVLIPVNSTNTTFNATFTVNDVNVTQVDPYGNGDPYGYYVVVKSGVPIKVVQNGQVYEGTLPEIRGYVPIVGIEDPYIWLNTKFRQRNAIYEYDHYEVNYLGAPDYHFDDSVSVSDIKIQYLWDCLNGTGNPQNISALPQYFPDPSGLNFFERLQGEKISGENNKTRLSTFIVGDPLRDVHQGAKISAIDSQYFAVPPVSGTNITLGTGGNIVTFRDPLGSVFYLSQTYKTTFDLANNYP
jgi:hypothetical protein